MPLKIFWLKWAEKRLEGLRALPCGRTVSNCGALLSSPFSGHRGVLVISNLPPLSLSLTLSRLQREILGHGGHLGAVFGARHLAIHLPNQQIIKVDSPLFLEEGGRNLRESSELPLPSRVLQPPDE